MLRRVLAFLWGAALLAAPNPVTIPQLQSVFPLSLSPGQASEIIVRGSSLEKVTGVLFDCGGMEAKILRVSAAGGAVVPGPGGAIAQGGAPAPSAPKTGATDEAHLSVTVAPDAKPGAYALRLYGPTGLSNYAVLMVGAASASIEDQTGTSPDHPQRLAIPAMVSGRIARPGEIHYYEIDVPASQSLQFELMTAAGAVRSIPPTFMDPQVIVYRRKGNWFDPAGLERVEMTDESFTFYNPPTNETQMYRRPRFVHRFQPAGKYLVAVRSASGAGGPEHIYLLRIAPVLAATPVSLSRWLPIRTVCEDPGDWDERTFERELRPDRLKQLAARNTGKTTEIPTIPVIPEKEPNQTLEEAMQLPIPALVEGVIATPGDTDTFRIWARAGEKLAFELEALELAPPYFSPLLTLFDAKGQKLYDNIYRKIGGDGDDWIKSIEPKMTTTFDKEGDYYLQVRDLTERNAGPLFRYRLAVRRQMPHVGEVAAHNFNPTGGESSEQRLNLAPGDVRKLIVVTGLEEGYDGEVALTVENLPPGVEALQAASTFHEIPLFPGERRAVLGAVGTERYRPVRLSTTLMLTVRADAAATPAPRLIRVVARPVVKNSIGRPIAGAQVPMMIVKGEEKKN